MADQNSLPEEHTTPHRFRLTRTKLVTGLATAALCGGLFVVWPRLAFVVLMSCAVFALLALAKRLENRPVERRVVSRSDRAVRAPSNGDRIERLPILGDRPRGKEHRSRRR
jgi:hypothetical protein